jgi:uncharacterized membrane protein
LGEEPNVILTYSKKTLKKIWKYEKVFVSLQSKRNQPNAIYESNNKTKVVLFNLKNKKMVKFQKVLLITGCVMSLLSGIISVIEKRFDTYAFISAMLFFNLYLSLLSNQRLSKLIDDHVENVKKIIKK